MNRFFTLLNIKLFLLLILFGFYQKHLSAAANEGSFTPTVVKVPIVGIYLHDKASGNGASLYECEGSLADCTVDIADNTVLTSLLAADSEIAVGSYDQIQISNCTTEGGYDVQFQGQMLLGGTTYYTTANADPLSISAGDLGLVTVSHSGCSNTFDLPQAVTVSEGGTVHISLYINLARIAWGKLGAKTIPGGCTENTGQTQSACIAYPDVVPYIGTTSPTVETYYISNNADAVGLSGGQIILLFDPSDNLLGGFSRRLLDQNSVPTAIQFDTPLKTFTDNGDGTYTLENYGSSADSFGFRMSNFQRANHAATYSDEASNTYSYTAHQQ